MGEKVLDVGWSPRAVLKSFGNPSGNPGPDRREGKKMEPKNLNHRQQICLRHTILYPGKHGGESINAHTDRTSLLGDD